MLDYTYGKITDNGSSTAGRLLLSLLCRHFGEKRAQELYGSIYKNDNGKPCLPNESGLYISISHEKNFAAAALADSEVGIDIEKVSPLTENKVKILERYFRGEDVSKAKADPSGKEFFRFWTRREAAFKAFATRPFYVEDPVPRHNIKTEEITEEGNTLLIISIACDGKL